VTARDAVDPASQELRLALAMNGGVSLAIWMGGVAVELDCARRAHIAPETVAVPEGPASTGPPRTIYHALCEGFQRSVVIDVMTGASAGGINGALLAGVIRARRRLHPDFLRDKWKKIGDLSELLQPLSNSRPRSIMRGDLFYDEVKNVFQAVLGSRDEPDQKNAQDVAQDLARTELPVEQRALTTHDAKLDVTATDVIGEERRFRDDWGFDLFARDYRARFKFRDACDFTVDNLATAARASASFPAAFEPVLVDTSMQLDLAGFSSARWLIDGGLLDNAPIRSALRLIPSRRAEREVERILCYVNADPPAPDEPARFGLEGPTLPNVGGYVLELPQRAPFIDHIEAMQAAIRERVTVAETLTPLLAMEVGKLRAVAECMLPAYSERRRLVAVADLFGSSGQAANDAATYLDISWPAFALNPPYSASTWAWGVRTGIEIVHMILDIIRAALPRATADERATLLRERLEVFDVLEGLERILSLSRNAVAEGGSPDASLDVTTAYNRSAFLGVKRAAGAAYRAADQLGRLPQDNRLVGDVLFGKERSPEMSDRSFEQFMKRALSIEVVRRSFMGNSETTSSQRISFAQLTPLTSCPIFSSTPITDEGPGTPEGKLTGIRLKHFAAFYRSSWRVNDFMWGRLDAATRLVQVLVDPLRANDPGLSWTKADPAYAISQALLPENATTVQRWLVDEALADAASADPGSNRAMRAVAEELAGHQLTQGSVPPEAGELRRLLRRAIELDLRNIDGGRFTRVVCTRGAQLEILANELPHLVSASKDDVPRGTLAPALNIPGEASRAAIENIRAGYQGGKTLPKRLGRDLPEELASTLALRTTTHAALVGLAALREAKLPLGGFVSAVRPLLLPAAGLAASRHRYRALALFAYWSCAAYLTSRIVTTHLDEPGNNRPLLAGAAALLAALVVLGTAAVPFLRARQAKSWRAATEYAFAGALVLLSCVVAGALAAWLGDLSLRDLIIAPGSRTAGGWLAFALAVGAGLPRARLPLIGGAVNRMIVRPWGGVSSAALVVVALLILVLPSLQGMHEVMTEGPELWQVLAVILAAASGLVATAYVELRGGH
jgi:predicted acylesterase/phospholipase RssA